MALTGSLKVNENVKYERHENGKVGLENTEFRWNKEKMGEPREKNLKFLTWSITRTLRRHWDFNAGPQA